MTLKHDFNRKTVRKPHLNVRFSSKADQKAIFDFYQENRHKHVDVRKAAIWNERSRNGRVIMIYDQDKNIGFVSVAYDFNDKGAHRWTEIGSTINQQNPAKEPYEMIKGITLYPFIIAAQVINEFLNHTPEDKIIANVYDDNPAVIHMLSRRAGWHNFEPDADILKACKATKDDTNAYGANRIWLTATTDTLPHQARVVLDVIDQGQKGGLWNKRTQQYIGLDSQEFSLAQEYRQAVAALAMGPLADELSRSPHMGMKKARKRLETHMRNMPQHDRSYGPKRPF